MRNSPAGARPQKEQFMIKNLPIVVLLASVTIACSSCGRAAHAANQESCTQQHSEWVAQALQRMLTVKPGMTRKDLLDVFTTEGGLSTGLQRTYGSRDCPFFKVDVVFEAVGRPSRDSEGRVTLVQDDRDIIVKISRPYLAWPTAD
jgi:hypothetical protein